VAGIGVYECVIWERILGSSILADLAPVPDPKLQPPSYIFGVVNSDGWRQCLTPSNFCRRMIIGIDVPELALVAAHINSKKGLTMSKIFAMK
jgi:hypothetical protein